MKYFKLFIALSFILYLLRCGEESDSVVGSLTHSLEIEKQDVPTVIADGLSSVYIYANVVDDSGAVASNMKVVFKTTAGSISENAMTDNYGIAKAMLTSASSTTDLNATVTATVVDPALSLAKSRVYSIALSTPGFEKKSMKKSSVDNTDEITVAFLGVTLTAALKDSIMPADGLTQTLLNIKLIETTSRKPVGGSQLVITSYSSTVDGSAETNDQGLAQLAVTASETVGLDTIAVHLGPEITAGQTVEYVTPILKVSAKSLAIFADGASRTEIVAALLTHKNTPVVGATIEFTTTDGRIEASAVTDNLGNATAILVAGENPKPAVNVVASFLSVKDSVQIAFVDQSSTMMTIEVDNIEILRDGIDAAQVSLEFNGENAADYANRIVYLYTDYGVVPDSIVTDAEGKAVFSFVSDAGAEDVVATVSASYGGVEKFVQLKLVGLDVRVTTALDSLPADGASQTTIRVSMRQAGSKIPISGYEVKFGTSEGTVERSGTTDDEGVVEKIYTSGTFPGDANLYIYVGAIRIEKILRLYQYQPSTLVLSTENNFIWVKNTGQIEQTDVSARLLGATGDPVNDPYNVTFTIVQGPSGGELLKTPSGYEGNSVTVGCENGLASVTLCSGTRSGAVQVRAEVVEYPQIRAEASHIVIRSGPPYMWVSPTDPDSVIQHGTVVIEPGKLNVAFGNPTQEIGVNAYFGDKYNNPIETGTVAYFTTTGGYISTDAATCELGKTSVILQNVNPFPVLHSEDPNQITVTSFPNPNGYGDAIDIWIPDFEQGIIPNTIGTTRENDGIATVFVTTNGQNQFGEDIKVWAAGHIVFSVGIHTFDVWTDRTVLAPGEAATIYIKVFDMNGNPLAAGSKLTVSTNEGEITFSDLMPEAESYGWGETSFSTQLVNTLDPAEDEPKTATVEIELESPNGDRFASLSFALTI